MRRVGKGMAAIKRKMKPERDDFLASFWLCQVCARKESVDVHEIARGPHRRKAIQHRCTWLAVCRDCHEELDNYSIWPLTRQLAVKLLHDGKHFDLPTFNVIRGRDEGAIEIEDVTKHLELKI